MNDFIGNSPNVAAFAGTAGQIKVGSISEEAFIQGKSFSFEDYIVFDTDEVIWIVMDPAAFAGRLLLFNNIIFAASSGPVTIDFYAGITSSAGTLLGASNRRAGFPAPTVTLTQGPTIADPGTRFAGDLVPASGLNPATSTGGASAGGLPFEPSRLVKTGFKMTNTDGADNHVQVKMTWYEL